MAECDETIGPVGFLLTYFKICGYDELFEIYKEYDKLPSYDDLSPVNLISKEEYAFFIKNFYKKGDLIIKTNFDHTFIGLDAANFFANIVPLEDKIGRAHV